MSTPVVSVVMGVYNGAGYLEQTLASVLSQEGCELEFIVVDDGSTDEAGRILDEWAARDSRLRVIHQHNTGLTRALIRGCAEARGEFIARQDAGDVSLPGRLQIQAELLSSCSEAVAVTCHTEFTGPAGEFLYSVEIDAATLNRSLSQAVDVLRGPSHHGSVMMRRSAYQQTGGYRAEFRFAQDLDLWTRIVEVGGFAVVPDVLYKARLMPYSISGTRAIEQRRLTEIIARATQTRRAGEDEESWLSKAAGVQAVQQRGKLRRVALGNYFIGCCLASRDPRAAMGYFRTAVSLRPTFVRGWLKLLLCYSRTMASSRNNSNAL